MTQLPTVQVYNYFCSDISISSYNHASTRSLVSKHSNISQLNWCEKSQGDYKVKDGQLHWWPSRATALGREDSGWYFLAHTLLFFSLGNSNIKQPTCFGRLQNLSTPPADLIINICWLKRKMTGKVCWPSTKIIFSFKKPETIPAFLGCSK